MFNKFHESYWHSNYLRFIFVIIFTGSISISCSSSDGGDTPVCGLQCNGLVGVWDVSRSDMDVDEQYIHFLNDGTYIVEASSYADTNGNKVNEPIFIYGTYTTTESSITIAPSYAADDNDDQIADADVDYCWIYAPFVDSVTFTDVYIKDSASMSTAELTGMAGGTVTYSPDISNTCEGDITLASEMTIGTKQSDIPGNLILK